MGIRSMVEKMKLKKWKKEGLIVGSNFKMNRGCTLDPTFPWLIEIGDNVSLAPEVTVLAHDASTQVHLGYTRLGNVKIGNDVFIGAGTIILPGVTIGNHVVIGAGSIVTRNIESGKVAIGAPARVVRTIEDFKQKYESRMTSEKLLDISYTKKGKITNTKKAEMKSRLCDEELFII